MAAHNNPLYSLVYTNPYPGTPSLDHPNKIPFSQKQLQTNDVNVHPQIIALLESFARDYIFDYGNKLQREMKATLTFSVKEGVVVHPDSNEEFVQFLKDKYKYFATTILENSPEYREIAPSKIKTISASVEDEKKLHDEYPGENFLFCDSFAYVLWSNQLFDPITIDLDLIPRKPFGGAAGLTTAHLRYPHMLLDLVTRYALARTSEEAKICIIGPGLLQQKKTSASCPQIYPSCPQFVELLSLFPNAHFSLLEKDQEAIKTLNMHFQICKFASYDPLTFRVFSDSFHSGNRLRSPDHYQPLLKEMRDGLSALVLKPVPKVASQMLEGYGDIMPLLVKVDPKKVHIQEFDILSSPMEQRVFDIIVATFSVSNAFEIERKQNRELNPFPQFLSILHSLKEEGSLYMDKPGWNGILKRCAAILNLNIEECIQQIEGQLGNKLKLTDVPLSDYLQGHVGDISSIPNVLIGSAGMDKGIGDVGTASIMVITRTSEKS